MIKTAVRPVHLPGFKKFIFKNMVLWIALLAAAVTCFFVPVDAAYADYFDLRTGLSVLHIAGRVRFS